MGRLVLVLSCLGRRDGLVTQYQLCAQGSSKLEDFHLGDLRMQSLENEVDGGIRGNKVLKVITRFRGRGGERGLPRVIVSAVSWS